MFQVPLHGSENKLESVAPEAQSRDLSGTTDDCPFHSSVTIITAPSSHRVQSVLLWPRDVSGSATSVATQDGLGNMIMKIVICL